MNAPTMNSAMTRGFEVVTVISNVGARFQAILKEENLTRKCSRAAYPCPAADLVFSFVRDRAQIVSGHERVHVMQLVRVNVQ